MIRTCKVKLGRAHKQEARLDEVLGLCCDLYNAALQQRIEAYKKQGISLSLYDQQKELTLLRGEDPEYQKLTATMTRLTALDRLDKAFKGFFRRVKAGEKPGFPRYKGKDRFNTLIFDTAGWKIEGKKLIIKIKGGPVVLNMRNKIFRQGEIKRLQIVNRAGRWWAHFLVDAGDVPEVKTSKNEVGIDVGLKDFAVLSTGEVIEHPKFLKQNLEQIKELNRVLSRKKRGSNNRKKAKVKLARAYDKIKNRRRNFICQTVATLMEEHDGFAVEKLDIQGMLDKTQEPEGLGKKSARGIRRGIRDSAWGMFRAQLENKAEEAGFPVVAVDPKGTSQMCSACGYFVKKALKDLEHTCSACGLVIDRDLNAAINILNKAKNDLGCRLAAGSTDGCVKGAEVSVT